MTLTFNPQKYQQLLLTYQPRIIRTEIENEKALLMVESLMHRKDRTPEEDELYELLITLIEKFEREHYSTPATDPKSLLFFLLEQRSLSIQNLIELLGLESDVIEDLINGVPNTYHTQSKLLGEFFNVDPSLFLT